MFDEFSGTCWKCKSRKAKYYGNDTDSDGKKTGLCESCFKDIHGIKKTSLICKWCGRGIEHSVYRFAHSNNAYCSLGCAANAVDLFTRVDARKREKEQ